VIHTKRPFTEAIIFFTQINNSPTRVDVQGTGADPDTFSIFKNVYLEILMARVSICS
jgi:hypothetical protein